MKSASFAIVCLFLTPCAFFGTGAPAFEDGHDSIIVDLKAPDFKAMLNLTIPAGYFVSNVNMSVTGMPAERNSTAYPEYVTMKLDNTTIWGFQETGFGPFGMQDRFYDGRKNVNIQFPSNGGSSQAKLRLPKDADIQTATMDIDLKTTIPWKLGTAIDGLPSYFGQYVSSAGDINGDGVDDLLIGIPYNSTNGSHAGRADIYLGGKKFNSTPDLQMFGMAKDDGFGRVACAGDLNGDNYDDIIIGAPSNDAGGNNSGRAYIFFGGSKLDNSSDLLLTGISNNDFFSCSVSSAGDINGDGYCDVVVGAWGTDKAGNNSGSAYIFFGGKNMDNVYDIRLDGPSENDSFGTSVSCAGDVNNDTYSDVIIGAKYNNSLGDSTGAAYLFFGGQTMENGTDVIFSAVATDNNFGTSVSGAGDMNNDGFDDVIIGAPTNRQNGPGSGQAYIYFGGQHMDNQSDMTFTGGPHGNFGDTVSEAGDIDNDGYGDVIIGAPHANGNEDYSGCAYVAFGGPTIDNTTDLTFPGEYYSDKFGCSVAGGCDLNGDGYDDVIVGADSYKHPGGRVYIFSLHNESINETISKMNITIGSKKAWEMSGYSVINDSIGDFSQLLNEYLKGPVSVDNDIFGNQYVDIPINMTTNDDGKLNLSNLNILYSVNATTLNFYTAFNDYMSKHQNEKDAEGNIKMPINITAQSRGRMKLFELNYTENRPPIQMVELNNPTLDEDTANITLLNLYAYFDDDSGPDNTLKFSVVSSTNASFVRLWITGQKYLSADAMTGDANNNWTGTVETIIACIDRWGASTQSNEFTIVVKNVNDPPEITSSPSTTAEPGMPYFYNITCVDGDNDILQYNLTQFPTGMTIGHDSGVVEWIPSARGIFNVTLTVDDGMILSEQSFKITVPNKNPKITSTPPLNATAGVPYSYTINAEDANLDALNFSLANSPEGMAIESTTGSITWTPKQSGDFAVSVRVSDGFGKTFQNFTIKVIAGTQTNRVPQFKSTPVTNAVLNEPYTYIASAIDADQDGLIFSLESGPPGMTVDPATGKMTWTPSAAGNFTVVLKVSDGKGGEAMQEFVIYVPGVQKPQLILVSHRSGQTLKGTITFSGTVTKGTREVATVQLRIDGTDWTDAAGNYSWSQKLDTKTLKNGMHSFEFRAYDGKEYSDVVKAEFKVDNVVAAGKGFIPGFDGTAVIAVLSMASLFCLWRRRQVLL